MNECVVLAGFDLFNVIQIVNKWILVEVQLIVVVVNKGLDEYCFNEVVVVVYCFVWNIFCDWYLEFVKLLFGGEDVVVKVEIQVMIVYVFDIVLKILYFFMLFVIEVLWMEIVKCDIQLIVVDWLQLYGLVNVDVEVEMSWFIDVIINICSFKVEMNIVLGKLLNVVLVGVL